MSDCSEDELPELPNFGDLKKDERFQVSGWDDDDQGIEEERNPDVPAEKEVLEAAQDGKLDVLAKLITQDKNLLNAKDKDGYTPLHRACYSDHPAVVEFLLKSGARHDAETIDLWKPIHSATRWNNVECARILLSYGADVNAASPGGATALHLAAGHRDGREMLQLLLSHPEIRVDLKDASGDTPLNHALRSGNNDVLFEPFEECFQPDY